MFKKFKLYSNIAMGNKVSIYMTYLKKKNTYQS